MPKNKFEVHKNIKDLEYKKILYDYNATLIATFSATIAFIGIAYQIYKNWIFSLSMGIFAFLLINSLRKNIENKLKTKLEEIKDLEWFIF